MRTVIALALLIGLSSGTTLRAAESNSALNQCLQAALARKDGSIVKLEVEIAQFSAESYAPPKGTALLEIEIRTPDGTEWELTCEEASGKIVEIEQEVPDASHALFSVKSKVTEDQARKVALASIPGEIVETEYEIESNGAASYEFDVKPKAGGGKWKVEVDATTGKIVESRRVLYQIGEEPSSTSR